MTADRLREMFLCASDQSHFSVFLSGLARPSRFIYISWWLLAFRSESLRIVWEEEAGSLPELAGAESQSLNEGQRQLSRFSVPATLCSWIFRLHHLTSGHPDCQLIHGLSFWPEPTLRMWLKSILLDPSLEVQVHPFGATQNNWTSGPHGIRNDIDYY